MPKNPDDVGALWENESARGPYMSGTIEGVGKVVVFRNDRKKSKKEPDWRILRSRPKEERAAAERLDDRADTARRPSRVDDPDDSILF